MSKLLDQESLVKIYRGTRRLGAAFPIIVVTGDTMRVNTPFSESYIFHEFPDVPFLYRRTNCSAADELHPFNFGEFPEIFRASALLTSEFRRACERLEFEVRKLDHSLHRDLFSSGSPMHYEEIGDLPFIEFRAFRQYVGERAAMFEFSRSDAISKLKIKLLGIPEFTLLQEPRP